MIVLGVDPDLHSTALAVVQDGVPLAVKVVRVPDLYKDESAVVAMIEEMAATGKQLVFDMLVVEGQRLYEKPRHPRPNDIVNLARVAGGVAGVLLAKKRCPLLMPSPQKWKGQLPKKVHHARIITHLVGGWEALHRCEGWSDVKASEEIHVLDAVGLALWGLEQTRSVNSTARRASPPVPH